jgi:hypothetical protein
MMKRIWIILIFVAALLAMWVVLMYIGLAMNEENVRQAWVQVEKVEGGRDGANGAPEGEGGMVASGVEGVLKDAVATCEERENYVRLLAEYNASLKKFPASVFAPMFGFAPMEAAK